MIRKILAVFEPQMEYADLFLSYVKEMRESVFDTRVFTKQSALQDFMKEHEVEVLLASEHSDYKEAAKEAKHTILLTEVRLVKEVDTYPMIYKFQSVEQILKEVFAICAEESKGEVTYLPKQTRWCKCYVVFSPYGGVGKTTLSLVLGHLLGNRKKVLVVHMAPFGRVQSWCGQPDNPAISRLFYAMKQGRKDLELRIQSLVTHVGNVDLLYGVEHYLDIQSMSASDMENFLQTLQHYTQYDVLVFDVSFLNEGLQVLLEHSDKIYEPVREHRKDSKWLQHFTIEEQARWKDKLRKVYLPWQKELPGSLEVTVRGIFGNAVEEVLERDEGYGGVTEKYL